MSKGPRRLGRGLSSLVSTDLSPQEGGTALRLDADTAPPQGLLRQGLATRLMAVPVDEIRQNPMQPRRSFGEQGLASLAASIRSKGALQPVLIRPAAGGYELVAGERRLRAARIAGLAEIPAIVRSVPDHELLELALVENIHREDLNPIDRARAYRALQERYDLSHEEIAQRLGDDRSTIANYVRLLGLSEELVSLVSSNELGVGHAKALLGLSDPNLQTSLGQRVVREGWSVRRLEAAVAEAKHGEAPRAREPKVRPAVTNMEQKLGEALGTRVIIRESRRRHSGRIVIEYYSLDDFERIVMLLGVPEESS